MELSGLEDEKNTDDNISMVENIKNTKRLELLSMAQSMIDENGLANFSLRGLARKWGCSAPSLYEYFGSLHEIFAILRKRENEKFSETLEQAAQLSTSPDQVVANLIRSYIQHFEGQSGRFEIMFESAKSQRGIVNAELPEGSPYQILLDAMAEYGQALGCKEDPSEEWAFAAWSYAHGACVLRATFLNSLALEIDPLISTGVDILVRGLAADAKERQ